MPLLPRKLALGTQDMLLYAIVKNLAERGEGAIPDFRKILVLLPTAEAARSLREAMAERFPTGVTNLQVDMPEILIVPQVPVASDQQVMVRWTECLHRIAPEQYRNLLPNLRELDSDERLLAAAEKLQNCRKTLAGEGLSLGEVYRDLDELCKSTCHEDEYCRFAEFYELEQDFLSGFDAAAGEPVLAQLNRQNSPQVPPGIENILLVAAPDIPNGIVKAAQNLLAQNVQLEIWVGAEASELADFDDWGRPLAEKFARRELALDLPAQVRRFAKDADQVQKIVQLLGQSCAKNVQAEFVPGFFGILSPAIGGKLVAELTRQKRDLTLRWIEQKPLKSLPLSRLFLQFLQLTQNEVEPEVYYRLLQDGLMQSYLGFDADYVAVLGTLDCLRHEHLPGTLAEVEYWLAKLTGSTFENTAQNAQKTLLYWQKIAEIHQIMRQTDDPVRTAYNLLSEVGQAQDINSFDHYELTTELDKLKTLVVANLELPDRKQAVKFLLCQIGRTQVAFAPEPDGEFIASGGFFELPFCTETQLLIAGFNEENFDYGSDSDSFLPDVARVKLGMRSRRDRYAADVHRLDVVLRNRDAGRGTVKFLFSLQDEQGTVLKPSRLLLQCGNTELPQRVKVLFGAGLEELPVVAKSVVVERCLQLEQVTPVKRISVTDFKTYLASPFLFYCDRVLKAQKVGERDYEMDAMQYGTIVHRLLERFARAYYKQDIPDAGELIGFLQCELQKVQAEDFGRNGNALVQIQFDLIQKSLVDFVNLQMEHYAQNWRIGALPERKVQCRWSDLFYDDARRPEPDDWRSQIILTGTIDRIDYNAARDEYWVLDYKNSQKDKLPGKSSLANKPPAAADDADDWSLTPLTLDSDKGHKGQYWRDLQLPLYVRLLEKNLVPDLERKPQLGRIRAGYFTLATVKGYSGVFEFTELQQSGAIASAVKCADMVLQKIFIEKRFWPIPDKFNKYDSLKAVLPGVSGADFAPWECDK